MNLVAVVQDVDLVLRWPLVAVGRIRDGVIIQHKSLQLMTLRFQFGYLVY
ncbi:hypothetical protein Hanom_Chr07g00649971 [Helianthus anomalus]